MKTEIRAERATNNPVYRSGPIVDAALWTRDQKWHCLALKQWCMGRLYSCMQRINQCTNQLLGDIFLHSLVKIERGLGLTDSAALSWRFYQGNFVSEARGCFLERCILRCSACCNLCYRMSELTSRLSPFYFQRLSLLCGNG